MMRTLFLVITASWLVYTANAANIRRGIVETVDETKKNEQDMNRVGSRPFGDTTYDESDERQLYHLYVVPPTSTDDLKLRFSKIVFQSPDVDTSRLPLTADDYPLQLETALWLSESMCPSVTIPSVCPECEGIDFDALVEAIGGPPSHASRNPSDEFWNELLEVAVVQEQRKNGTDANRVLPLPYIWRDYNLSQVAEAVHDEYPGIHHQNLIQYLLGDGATVDNTTIPQHCNAEFLRGIIMLSHLNTWAIANVGPVNFAVKYYVGRARPEEIAYKISTRDLDDEVPQALLDLIPENSLENMRNFTAYPEGSPMHPSWPAMHSAASVGSLWLAVVLNLTEDQHCEAKLVDYGVAYARTVAGVHYATDNIAGLKLGSKLIEDYLPEYLEEMYGSDPVAVQNKIDAVKVDWDGFLDSDCYKKNMM